VAGLLSLLLGLVSQSLEMLVEQSIQDIRKIMTHSKPLLFCLSLSILLLTACGGSGGSSLFDVDLTDDANALLVAETGGHTTAGLEIVLLGAGLLTEVPLGELPEEAVQVAETALNTLLSDCLTAEVLTDGGTGLSLQFDDSGCGIPKTNVSLKGGFSFQTDSTEATDTWALGFDQFEVAGVEVDGDLEVTIEASEKLDFSIDFLSIVSSSQNIELDTSGSLTTNSAHTKVTFDGKGSLDLDDDTFEVEATNINRSFITDCFPEAGSISVSFTSDDGEVQQATLAFEDDGLGLDSDDSGLVRITLNGEEHIAELPSRNCSGF
jgi:hypothetical protein